MCSNSSLFSSMTKLSQSFLSVFRLDILYLIIIFCDVKTQENFTLQGVFYIPCFKYNLVSITKFTYQLKTFVLFIDKTCHVQDPLLNNKLSLGFLGNRLNDLYVFFFILGHLKLLCHSVFQFFLFYPCFIIL